MNREIEAFNEGQSTVEGQQICSSLATDNGLEKGKFLSQQSSTWH